MAYSQWWLTICGSDFHFVDLLYSHCDFHVPYMFVHRGHTCEGVTITVPADKLGLCLVCRFKSLPGMLLFLVPATE